MQRPLPILDWTGRVSPEKECGGNRQAVSCAPDDLQPSPRQRRIPASLHRKGPDAERIRPREETRFPTNLRVPPLVHCPPTVRESAEMLHHTANPDRSCDGRSHRLALISCRHVESTSTRQSQIPCARYAANQLHEATS